jgi:hypothetical protein
LDFAVPGVAAAGAGAAAGTAGGNAPSTVVVVSPMPGMARTMVPPNTVVGGTVVGGTVVAATVRVGSTAPTGGTVVVVLDASGWLAAAITVVRPNTAEAVAPVMRMRAPAAT